MRILYISANSPHLALTGSSVRAGHFVRQLATHFEMDVVFLDGAGHPPPAYQPELPKIKGIDIQERVDFTQFGYFVFSRELYARAASLMRRRSHDLIVCDYGLAATYGLLLSTRFGVPFIYSSHNVEYLMYRDRARTDRRRWGLLPYVWLVEKLGVQRSQLVVAITESDAEHYVRWASRDKMMVIPQGFDPAIFNPFYEHMPNDRKTIVYCGNYNNSFNREVVKIVVDRVLPKVLPSLPEIRFRFVGPDPPRDVHHPNVEFVGFANEAQNAAFLKQADLVISARAQQRGFPTKIVEALACGKPLLSTPMGVRSIPTDYESLYVRDIDEFAPTICEILNEDQPVRTTDYDKIKHRYAWETNVRRLADRLAV